MPVYTVFAMGAATMLAGHLAVLPMICYVLDMADHMVKLAQLRAKFVLAKENSWKNRAALKKVRSIMPIKLKYGKFWKIDKDFAAEYFWLIVLRTFDAILLINN